MRLPAQKASSRLHATESMRPYLHTSAYVSIRQHASAYVSMHQHASACISIRQHASAYVRIRQHIYFLSLALALSIHNKQLIQSFCFMYVLLQILMARLSLLDHTLTITLSNLSSINPVSSLRVPVPCTTQL